MTPNPIHIGRLILTELNRQGRTVGWLADRLSIRRPNCYRLLRAATIRTDRLYRISEALRHDFFADYSEQLQSTLRGDEGEKTEK